MSKSPKTELTLRANNCHPGTRTIRPHVLSGPIKLISRPYVEQQVPGKASFKAVVARPYIEPQMPGKPSLKSVVSKPYVEGNIAPIGPPRQPQQ